MNVTITKTTYGPCPAWCGEHHPRDREERENYRHHLGHEAVVQLTAVDAGAEGATIRIELTRYDDGGELGPVGIFTGHRGVGANGEPGWWDLLSVPIDLESAERLADALLEAVRIGRAGGAR